MILLKNKSLCCLLLLIGIIFLISCNKNNIETINNNSVELYGCQEKSAEPYICFDSLLSDSRCPKGMVCIWQGTALIKISFHEKGNTHPLKMYLKRDTTIDGYKITFTDLQPYPDTNAPAPQPAKIIATFSIFH